MLAKDGLKEVIPFRRYDACLVISSHRIREVSPRSNRERERGWKKDEDIQ
jgi:hypothetical protein